MHHVCAVHIYFQTCYLFQTGDACLVQLAARYTQELQRSVGSLNYTTSSTIINYPDVLQQLEDLRLAEWSDHAPPPPSAPIPGNFSSSLLTFNFDYHIMFMQILCVYLYMHPLIIIYAIM